MMKVMLNQGSKIIICLLLLLSSCKKEPTQAEIELERKLRLQESRIKRELYKNFSKKWIGEKEYNQVYQNAQDSIDNWIKNKLEYTNQFKNGFVLDSLICFNRQKNKCVMALSNDSSSAMKFFYGIKIKAAWYFFRGATIYLPSEYYQDDETKPLSLALLNQIAIEEVFSGYLKKEKFSNKYDIDDNFFNDITDTQDKGFEKCVTDEDFDKAYLNHIKINWLSTYKPLKKEEIHYKYNTNNKKLRIRFPIHLPNLTNCRLYGIAIRYWEKLPPKGEEKQINRFEPLFEFSNRESTEKGLYEEGEYKNDFIMVDAKGTPIKKYSKLITGIDPNKQYTIKITFKYSEGCAFFVTDFSAKNDTNKKLD